MYLHWFINYFMPCVLVLYFIPHLFLGVCVVSDVDKLPDFWRVYLLIFPVKINTQFIEDTKHTARIYDAFECNISTNAQPLYFNSSTYIK